MLFVHISDIHFENHAGFDPDSGVREALLEDLDRQVAMLGNATAILVSGDIAYSGKAVEYGLAATWLEEVCGVAGCEPNAVLVCPGNHDVDLVKADGGLVGGLRASLRAATQLPITDESAKWSAHDKLLGGFVSNTDSAIQLSSPLTDYNDFASRFGCGCDPSANRLFWETDMPLGSLALRIRGLNSALISSREDRPGNLFVGRQATDFGRQPGIVRMVMCHHPVNWLMDRNSIRDRLDEGCQIQLFGHEHDSRVDASDRTVRIFGGCLQPDRKNAPWWPAYNLISIVDCPGGDRPTVEVEVHGRNWQSRPAQFVPHHFEDGEAVKRCKIVLPRRRSVRAERSAANGHSAPEAANLDASEQSVVEEEGVAEVEMEVVVGDIRPPALSPELAWRFFRLPPHRRREIIGKLKLGADEDAALPDFAKMQHCLRRADAGGRVPDLMIEVEAAEARARPLVEKAS